MPGQNFTQDLSENIKVGATQVQTAAGFGLSLEEEIDVTAEGSDVESGLYPGLSVRDRSFDVRAP
jgi:hypothetical protein